jgi:hypothetical protein
MTITYTTIKYQVRRVFDDKLLGTFPDMEDAIAYVNELVEQHINAEVYEV